MSWLPNEWPKTVVMIEQAQLGANGAEFIPVGTGFITEYNNINILVTSKHLIFDVQQKKFIENLFVSFNLKTGTRGRRKIEDIKKIFSVDWIFHENENVDLAVMPFSIDERNDDMKRMGRDLYESIENLFEGDEVFFLGFPLAIDAGGQQSIRPVVRQGIISLIQQDKNFLIDAHVFPGNSGSPVFLKPSFMDFKTNTFGKVRPAKFIGIINSYISYFDTAISAHTKRARVIFEENSGLARVMGVHVLNEIFNSDKFNNIIKGIV